MWLQVFLCYLIIGLKFPFYLLFACFYYYDSPYLRPLRVAWWPSGLVTRQSALWSRVRSQWQLVRSAIITEAVFYSFLITSRWFPRGTPVSFTNKKKLLRSNSKLVSSCGGRLSAYLLSLHNRAGVAGGRSALTSHRLKNKALVKIRHLFIYYLTAFISDIHTLIDKLFVIVL